MNRRTFLGMAGLAIAAGTFARPTAAGRTPEEAQALVARAIALYREKGIAAFAVISWPDGGFIDGELYVFVIAPDRRIVAHAELDRLGIDVGPIVDIDGKPYGRLLVEEATPEGTWLDYKRKNPVTSQIEPKRSWIVKVDGYVFGSGVYGP
jgi:cytochrome c